VVRRTVWVTLLAVTACGHSLADGSACRPVGSSSALPNALRETSGVAVRSPGLIWTHNDGDRRPRLYVVDRDGQVQARIEVDRSFNDWEDIARGRCDLGACLYLADTGDNDERRDNISFYRLAEPDEEEEARVDAERYRMVLPDGPRDIEAMYVLPSEQIFFVTKGRNHPVTIYRYPPPLRSEDTVTLVEVQRLTTGPMAGPRMVTGASATLDGGTVAIRTYQSLQFFAVTGGGRLLESDLGRVDLRPLREAQGEGVGFGANGTIVLTSESAGGVAPSLTFLSCNLNPAASDQPEPTQDPPA
jgi:hypothetical protein